jgi:ribosome-associated protein
MQEDDDTQDFDGRPSKSARKRDATAAQRLGTKLIELKESDLAALELPETLYDAIMLAKRITSRGGLARQRQYIGKLMRDVDPGPIEAALSAESRATAVDAERHKQLETWRERLLTEGPRALDDLKKWTPGADRRALQALIDKATSTRVDPGSRETASRALFRALRDLFESGALP